MDGNVDGADLREGEPLLINEWEGGLTFLLGAFMLLIGAVALVGHHGRNASPGWLPWVIGPVVLTLGAVLMLNARSGLTVEGDGLVVQGAFTRRHLAWREIRQVELAWRWTYTSTWLRIELLDGSRRWAAGFFPRTRAQRNLVDGWIIEMNRRVARASSVAARD
jgi:hypothetical protein